MLYWRDWPSAPHAHPGCSGVSPRAPEYLDSISGLRFFAALHIVLLHTFRASWLPEPVDRLMRWGGSTTSLFFILSGFILTYVYAQPRAGLRITDREFWWRRAVRLYPLAIAGHLLVLPLVWTTYPSGERWLRAATALTGVQGFWPRFADSFNTPAWSLSLFGLGYLLLPGLLRRTSQWSSRQLLGALGGLWLAMLAPAAAYVALQPSAHVWLAGLYTFPLVRLPEFLFGVAFARLLATARWPALPSWVAPAAVIGIIASLVLTPKVLLPLNHNGLYAPLHAVLIWSVAFGGGLVARVLSHPLAKRLGHASFGIFLLHIPVYVWAMTLTRGRVEEWGILGSAAFYFLFLASTLVLADLAERRLVTPLAQHLRRLRSARGSAPV
jgi:peptidoglycan/LPS O-acetylase OafA/YrhL